MGYHNADEIPNYWTYARDFVLQDHMFEAVSSWSLPAHLYEVSAWSAYCPVPRQPDGVRERSGAAGAAARTSGRPRRAGPRPTDRARSTTGRTSPT